MMVFVINTNQIGIISNININKIFLICQKNHQTKFLKMKMNLILIKLKI